MSARAPRLLCLALTASASAAGAQNRIDRFTLHRAAGAMMAPAGDPSDIVSAEIAFAQLARDKGQWTAFRATADKDAVMFVPMAVNAQAWLRKRKDPARSMSWQPTAIYVSCDGSYAASTGDWKRPDGSTGTFVTIWRRQHRGDYKWVLDWGGGKPASGRSDSEIDGKVAQCAARARGPMGESDGNPERERRGKAARLEIVRIADPPPADGAGQSPDGSLRWSWTSDAAKGRTLMVRMRTAEGLETVIQDSLPADAS